MYRATEIMTPEEIDKYCREIQPVIEAEYDADNPAAVVDRATTLEGYLALSVKLVADSKFRYQEQLEGIFVKAIRENTEMSASILAKYLDNLCRDLQYLVNWSDRINRTLVHQIELARTIISKLKQEAQFSQNANWR